MSIIKARGTWYLFDDDNVEAIKETDIPKYFGDSNSGSAYVLYYQASDLDISALGLRAPEPMAASETNANNASISNSRSTLTPTAENAEYEGASPSLPPGLPIETGQNARVSPSMAPAPPTIITSPAFPAPSSPDLQPQSPSSPSKPQLKLPLHIPMPPPPSTDAVPSSPTAPPTPGSSSTRGFFGSLRHAPSLRIRPSTSNGVPDRKSTVDVPPVPPIPIAVSSSMSMGRPVSLDQGSGNVNGELSASPVPASAASVSASPMSASMSTSPSVSTIASNGKEKDKEKEKSTPGIWFKRKSFRQEKPPPSSGSNAVGERSNSVNGSATDEPTMPWYKSAKRVQRRASEAGLVSPAAFSAAANPSSYQQASPLFHTSIPTSLVPVPEHKRSTPEFSPAEVSERRSSRRPATAGGTIERPSSTYIPPVPSLSSSPSPHSPLADPKSAVDGRHSPLTNGIAALPNGAAPPHEPAHHQRYVRPHTSHAHPPSPPVAGLGFSSSNGTSSTLNTTTGESASTGSSSTSGGKTKRATRKLSFSAPMLGFGRKDKDRQRAQSPAYSQTSSAGNR